MERRTVILSGFFVPKLNTTECNLVREFYTLGNIESIVTCTVGSILTLTAY